MRRAIVFLAVILWAASAAAVDPTATLSLPNPGARSMALGGAFVAQADDATAAFANPAGLVQLLDPEISAELRLWLFSSDNQEGFSSEDSEVANINSVGFLSGVYPIGRFSIALYRNQLAKYEINEDAGTWDSELWSINSFEIVTWGLSGAFQITERLSIGIGAAYNEGELETTVDGNEVPSSGEEWSFNTGLLWQPTAAFNFGGFYRQGVEFQSANVSSASASPLAVPDVYGLGAAFRSSGGGLTLLAEWDHVRYSAVDGTVIGDAVVRFDDADELHLGAEYAFLGARPIIALRLGAWYDPAHRWLEEAGSRQSLGNDEMHGSAGMGLTWDRFQLDFAFDISDPVITTSVSGIFSF